jgi:hypothetical protein
MTPYARHNQTERQDGDEEQDLYEAEETELLKDHGPGENEHDIDVEGDEEQGECRRRADTGSTEPIGVSTNSKIANLGLAGCRLSRSAFNVSAIVRAKRTNAQPPRKKMAAIKYPVATTYTSRPG